MSKLTIHEEFLRRFPEPDMEAVVSGHYEYYHYLRDGVDDRGWGCGYRTLQTLTSWIIHNAKSLHKPYSAHEVPSISQIQETIVKYDDTKSEQFVGSKEWIGSYEMFLMLDGMFDVPCRLVHCRDGTELENHVDSIVEHLKTRNAPIPIGGDRDASSKAIFGVKRTSSGASFLIVDPHFVASNHGQDRKENERISKGSSEAIDGNFVRWMRLEEFDKSSFYNLCFAIV